MVSKSNNHAIGICTEYDVAVSSVLAVCKKRGINLTTSSPTNLINRRADEKLKYCDFDANIFHEVWSPSGAREEVIDAAAQHGVVVLVVPGVSLDDSARGLELAKLDARIVTTVGCHPYMATEPCSEQIRCDFLRLAEDPYCMAIGECGLDYSEGFPARELQTAWFEFQVEMACQLQKPLFLHVRQAHDDFLAIMGSHGFGANLPAPLLPCCVHCFTGTTDELNQYLDWGFYIGLTGHIFSLPKEELVEWLQLITLDKLVIETDAPYMGFKGCRQSEKSKKQSKFPNVPAALPLIAKAIAAAGGWSEGEVAQRTMANSLRFFGK